MDSLWILIEILLINMVLSGDNAVVIAMSTQHLPEAQRKVAIWWGAAGAVILRILLTVVALWLMDIPLLQAVGGVLLFVIAIQLLGNGNSHAVSERNTTSLRSAVGTILTADVIMSLDNVLAIAAISEGHFPYLVIGIALSIPIVVWGSALVSRWLETFPLLVYAGAGILGYTAGKMMASDERLLLWLPAWEGIKGTLPWALTLLVLVLGIWFRSNPKPSM
ncbi:TerC family protein [Paenibacillus assamensis]|uniref:TerC family protein n=1 Tax=Paenibacillus assamensis TaxID=311244 RepID=UPI0003F62A38|nr:TerC family protein [Paenibacillus assamensis]